MKAPTYGKRGGLKAFDRGSRKISHAYGKATVLTHGSKANGGFALESESERMVAHMLNLDPDVVSYSAQPFSVELTTGNIARSGEEKDTLRARARRHGGKAVFYTPDFGLVWASGVQAAVEVKLDQFPGDAEYQRKLKLAGDILLGLGYEFLQLVTPSNWRHPLRTNLPLLHQAHMRQDMWPTPETGDRIEVLHEAGAKTMGDYLGGLALDARMSPLLLVSGHLEADVVGQALCFATPAGPACGDLSHLQLVRRLAQ
jgi:hypothetical protein